jgi:hypothetical protein
MQFIVDTATHRRAFGQRRLLFSWQSFYAGVGVAMAMMVITVNFSPKRDVAHVEATATRSTVIAESIQQHVGVAATLPGTVTAAELVKAIEGASLAANGQTSAALDYLRARATALANAVDREYATLAVMELSGRTRPEAERMVDTWLQVGRLLAH